MRPPGSRTSTCLRRRSLLSGTVALAAAQAGCSGPAGEGAPTRSATPAPTRTQSSERVPSRVLVAYFSRAGENYYYGDRTDLEVGNTEVLARIFSRRLRELRVNHDVHQVTAAEPYPRDYDETVARNVREQDTDARPEIAHPLGAIDRYDTVLLASPIWNLRPPMIMHTFADSLDWNGTRVLPVTTYAVSGLGTAQRDYADACAGATIDEGLAVQGEKVRSRGPAAVADWLDRVDLGEPGRGGL